MIETAPEHPLECDVGALIGTWLLLECANNRYHTAYPLQLMAREQGRAVKLGSVVPRLRCKCCKLPPSAVRLSQSPYPEGTFKGQPDHPSIGWKISLLD